METFHILLSAPLQSGRQGVRSGGLVMPVKGSAAQLHHESKSPTVPLSPFHAQFSGGPEERRPLQTCRVMVQPLKAGTAASLDPH